MGGEHALSHGTGETNPKLDTSAVSDTEQPTATAKAQLREEGKESQEELKALELKGETRENSVLLESGVSGLLQLYTTYIPFPSGLCALQCPGTLPKCPVTVALTKRRSTDSNQPTRTPAHYSAF